MKSIEGKDEDKINNNSNEPAAFEIPVKVIDSGKKSAPPVKIEIQDENEAGSAEKGSDPMKNKDTVIESKDERIKELEEQVRRLSAEFANFRVRQDKKLEEIRKYASENVICEFLPVLDSIDKALKAAENVQDSQSVKKGMEMIASQLKQTLERLNVEEIHAHMEVFDPKMHQAIHVVETDEHPDETVLSEFQKGYKLKDRVIRPAMVQVSRLPGSINSQESQEGSSEKGM